MTATLPRQTSTPERPPRHGCVRKFTSCRWVLAYLLFFLRICQTALRQSIGMCLVCMVDGPRERSGVNVTDNPLNQTRYDLSKEDFDNSSFTTITNAPGPMRDNEEPREFEWDAPFQGLVLSAYYYGYLLTPLLASYVERVVGAKRLVAISIGFGALINFVTPELTRINKHLLVATRVVAGTTNGMIDPAVQFLWSVWAPASEIASLCAVEYAGVSVGGILTFLISGLLCQIPFNNGWPFVFYFYGCANILWLVFWFTLIHNKPSDHPRITQEELKYIQSQTHSCAASSKKKLHPPWLKILSCPSVWALMLASATFTWVYSWVLCYLPRYMQDVLRYSIAENAVLSPLPFVGKFISGLVCGYLSDRLLRTGLSTTANRKMFQIIGTVGCAAVTVAIGFLDHDSRVLAVVLLVLLVTIQNVSTVAIRVNVLDIAPRYSGFILAICNTLAVAASLTGPLVTSAVLYEANQKQWQTMFYVVATISLMGGLIFMVMGRTKQQAWDSAHKDITITHEGLCDRTDKSTEDCEHQLTHHEGARERSERHLFHEQDKRMHVTDPRPGGCSGLQVLTAWSSTVSLT